MTTGTMTGSPSKAMLGLGLLALVTAVGVGTLTNPVPRPEHFKTPARIEQARLCDTLDWACAECRTYTECDSRAVEPQALMVCPYKSIKAGVEVVRYAIRWQWFDPATDLWNIGTEFTVDKAHRLDNYLINNGCITEPEWSVE